MTTRNRSANDVCARSPYMKIAREIGLRNRHRLISVSPRNNFCSNNAVSLYRYVDSLATVLRALKPEGN